MEIRSHLLSYDEQAIFALRSLYARYGYERYKMSRFEEYDLYVRNKDFLVSDQIITFTDRSGRLLALKPDVTLSIIKNAPYAPGVVQKVYYNENVYRADDSHNFREIMQSGLECIGDLTDYDIAEVVLLAAKSLALISHRFVLDLSHMGLVSAALEGSGLSAAGQQDALTCLKHKSIHELQAAAAARRRCWRPWRPGWTPRRCRMPSVNSAPCGRCCGMQASPVRYRSIFPCATI